LKYIVTIHFVLDPWHFCAGGAISRRLSQALSRITAYFSQWRLKVNIEKTEAILFTPNENYDRSKTIGECGIFQLFG
jgi:hypothetical protein